MRTLWRRTSGDITVQLKAWRRVLACLAIAVGVILTFVPSRADEPAAASSSTVAPRRVKVLWLGDEGHHQPLVRCRQIFSELARRGIDLTYTDDVTSLNP